MFLPMDSERRGSPGWTNKRLASGVGWIASVDEVCYKFVTQEKQKHVEFVVLIGLSTHGLPT